MKLRPSALLRPAETLQQLLARCHWSVADSALLQAVVQGIPCSRGNAGRKLNALVRVFERVRLTYALLFIVGAFELIKLLMQQSRNTERRIYVSSEGIANHSPATYFVGFGAGPEESLFATYCAEKDRPVVRINQTKVESMGRLHTVGVSEAFRFLWRALGSARQVMANLPKEFSPWRDDFLTFIGMRLGYYAYVRTWFAQLKESNPGVAEVCFLAADTAAFAAVDAGLPTRHLQHGLIRHSLVQPTFDRVDALTNEEVLHFRQRLPRADIHLARATMAPITLRKSPCVLVASVYFHHEEMRRVLPFLEFAAQHGMAIHVRPHPGEDRSFWCTGDLPVTVSLEDSDATFDAALERLQPSMVVSWFSTALVDTLYRSVIPVSVSARDDVNIQDLVYPLLRHCLHWPDDQNELETIIYDKTNYQATLSRLRFGME